MPIVKTPTSIPPIVPQGEVGHAAEVLVQSQAVEQGGERAPGDVVHHFALVQPGECGGHEHGAESADREHAQQAVGVQGSSFDVDPSHDGGYEGEQVVVGEHVGGPEGSRIVLSAPGAEPPFDQGDDVGDRKRHV